MAASKIKLIVEVKVNAYGKDHDGNVWDGPMRVFYVYTNLGALYVRAYDRAGARLAASIGMAA